ncbi:major facilitator superfamily domain-containing protein 6-like [Montipora capricornis]|uniref:major facilitator superfamily domain-containing protein 6-like n=1 Tax=Montipora capricornis TaxID=246305 RepID=UPI0035F2040F
MSKSNSQDAPHTSNAFSKLCPQYKDRIFHCLFYFFFETSFSFKMFFFPVYWQQMGLSPTQIGILRAFWGVGYSVGAVLFGKMANKWKIRKGLLLMSIAATVITPLVSLLPRRTHDNCVLRSQKIATSDFLRRTSLSQRRFHSNRAFTNITHFSQPSENHLKNDIAHGLKNFNEKNSNGSGTKRKRSLKKDISGGLTKYGSQSLVQEGRVPDYYRNTKQMTQRLPRQLQGDQGKQFVLEKNLRDIKNIFIMFIFIVFIGEFLSSPAFNLANAEIVEFLGEKSREFGKIRLWGPIGHMITAPSTAILVTHFHYMLCGEYQDSFVIVFIVIAAMAACAFLSVTQFRSEQKSANNKIDKKEDNGTPISLTTFFAQYQNLVFIIMTFLVGCFDGVVLTFGFWYTKTLDVSIATLVFGFSRMTCSAVSVIFLGSIGMCVERTGYSGVIAFSMLLFLSWFIGMSFMKNPWLMLIFETIGYVAYVVGFTGFISYFGEVTPSHLTDTVQGGVNSLFIGVGCGIGTALCGFLIDQFSAVSAFRLCAIGTIFVLVLFAVSQVAYFCLKQPKFVQREEIGS